MRRPIRIERAVPAAGSAARTRSASWARRVPARRVPGTIDRSEARAHRVLIVGSGFAGLSAVRSLRRAPVQVTVVASTNHHLFQPLLYQVATGILSEGEVARPTREILRRQSNAQVLLGDVIDIDLRRRFALVESMGVTSMVGYDSLIVAAGASQSYFGNDEFERFAPALKTVDDALELRGRIFGAFELAELEPDQRRRRAHLTFIVIGAGPTGVELAGEIAELSRRALKRNFRSVDPGSARVVLIDAVESVLPSFPTRLQERALKALRALGIEVRLGEKVVGIDARGVEVESADGVRQRIAGGTKIWAAGVRGSALGRILARGGHRSLDPAGRVRVAPDCSLPGHPEVFVVGDLMALDGLPGVAEVAIQSGRHAGRTIVHRLRGELELRPFRYRDRGMTATISRFNAVVALRRFRASGLLAWLVWLCVHLAFLNGYRNRVSAVANWAVAFGGNGRPQRTITAQQVLARSALNDQAARPPALESRSEALKAASCQAQRPAA
ncbi:MAG: NAD(P)/FAD-dependent oxidoreductase [Solirubrobacterales bacterium]|nr:NAD(P)/FAD-dependent oxidoreductase [Solirubrobacterales bacterium]